MRVRERVIRAGDVDLLVIEIEAEASRTARGPTVVLTANLHGDECSGLGALMMLIPMLEAGLRRGTVVLMPSLNPSGLERRQRRVPEDDQDLNRAFPGDPRGGVSDRLAAGIWSEVVRAAPELLVDLHADAPVALPYVLLDRAVSRRGVGRAELEARAQALATSTGFTVVHEYPDERYQRFRLDRSLTGAVLNRLGVPALTLEAGPKLVTDPAAAAALRDAVLRVLAGLEMMHPPDTARHPSCVPGRWRREAGPRAPVAGVYRPLLPLGARVSPGTPVVSIHSLSGRQLALLPAETAGFVLAYAERSHLVVGTPACTWATAEGAHDGADSAR